MFVVSMKTSKKKLVLFAGIVVMVVAGCLLLFGKGGDEAQAVSTIGKYNLSASDNAQRLSFFSQFGWEVKEEPLEICEIILPAEFNDTYQKYNDIQKQQGLDLGRYAGKSCKRWTYEVTNYPNKPQGVRANLLILDGKVIGGDICSTELDGFMHGFVKPESASNGSDNVNSSVESTAVNDTSSQGLLPVESSTERETLAPDPNMPEAPVD